MQIAYDRRRLPVIGWSHSWQTRLQGPHSHMSDVANFDAWVVRLPEWKSSRRWRRCRLAGDVSNRRPQILDRRPKRIRARRILQLMAFSYLTHDDGEIHNTYVCVCMYRYMHFRDVEQAKVVSMLSWVNAKYSTHWSASSLSRSMNELTEG